MGAKLSVLRHGLARLPISEAAGYDNQDICAALGQGAEMSAAQHSVNTEFVRAMGPVAIELLGEPSEKTVHEYRFGTRGSLSVDLDKGVWHDHEANVGGGVIDLVMAQKRTGKAGAIAWLRERKHIEPPTGKAAFKIVQSYDYVDQDGVLLFQVCRMDPKDFRQRRPDPDQPGRWLWKMGDIDRVLYRLPELLAAISEGRTIYIAEGEKAVDALRGLGVTATCSPGGVNKWRREQGTTLHRADVVIVPDNDEPGRQHAETIATNLRSMHARAARVRILDLPNLPKKGDVADWIDAGGTAEQLAALTDEAPEATEIPKAASPINDNVQEDLDEHGNVIGLGGYSLTEDGIALAFTAAHEDLLRYDHTRGKWYHWTGKSWRLDETRLAFSWCRRICRQLAKRPGLSAKTLSTMAKAATSASVERFAMSDPALAVTSSLWDNDTFLLGTPDGTLDLRTGEMRAPVPEDYITRLTAVTPAPKATCPLWLKFLAEVTNNDEGLIRFLQQWCGYTLTGDTREHALLFAHGGGGNGKGVFLNTISRIVGDYARTAAMETFTASSIDKHPTDLAMLRGARLVTASETEEGRAWAESRIKQMTGGDPIAARFMRQDFFEYIPQFKLTIIGNHKPVLRNVDDAARRRFNMVPFLFKPEQVDRQLEAKLRAEFPAILRWMIDGCLDWQKNGLIRPEVVIAATAEYFSEQDTVHQGVEDCCNLGRGQFDTLATLFKSWSDYAIANGEKPGTAKWFSQTLGKMSCEAVKNTPGAHGKRGFRGISVKLVKASAPQDTEDRWDRQF
jgi:putative DNA primase/helicase